MGHAEGCACVGCEVRRLRAENVRLRAVLAVLLGGSATPVPCQDSVIVGRVGLLAVNPDEC